MKNKNRFSLSGKNAVITGGCGLLGKAIAKAFLAAGARVIIADLIDGSKAEKNNVLRKRMHYEKFDMTNFPEIEKNVARIDRCFRDIDVWVNCAYPRTEDWHHRLEDIGEESFRKNVDWQLNSYCICSHEIAKRMRKRRHGVIINIASIYGMIAPDFSIYDGTQMTMPAAYSAIKGGVISYSRYLASYFKDSGIRINVVCPGGIYNRQAKSFVTKYSKKTLLGRMANPDEIAWPVVFLASDAASYITGAVIMVDGGWTCL